MTPEELCTPHMPLGVPKITPECLALRIIAWGEYKRKNTISFDLTEVIAEGIFRQAVEDLL